MALDFVATSDATKLPTRTRADASGTVEVVEGVTDYLDGSGIPTPVSATNPLPVTGTVTASGTVAVSNFPATQAVSAASLPLPTGALTEATLSALNAKVTAVNTGAVTVSSSVLPTGAATETTLAALNTKVTAVNTGAVVLAAGSAKVGQVAIDHTTPGTTDCVIAKIADTSGNGITSGSLTGGVRAVDVIIRDSTGAQVSSFGGNSVNLTQVNGTAMLTGGVAGSQGVGGLAASASSVAGNPVLVGGSDGTNARTVSTDTTGRVNVNANLSQINGTAISNANPLPVNMAGPATISGTLGALNAAVTFTGSLGIVGVQMVAVATGSTLSYTPEVSADGTTWVSTTSIVLSGWNNLGFGLATTGGFNSSSTGVLQSVWTPVPPGWQARLRCSTYTSGSATAYLMPMQDPPVEVINGQVTIQSGAVVNTSCTVTNTTGHTVFRTPSGGSAATTNGQNVKASNGRLTYLHVTNTSAGTKYVKIYNKATTPTVGTDTPVATYAIPASWSGVVYTGSDLGLSLSSGIGYGITGAAADSDTTAVAAGDVFLVGGFY